MTAALLLWVLAGVSIATNILAILGVLRRLFLMDRSRVRSNRKTVAILPLTGPVHGLPDLVARLNSQTVPIDRLLISVESEKDPAYRQAQLISASTEFPTIVVNSGLAVHEGQKCFNQLSALKLVPNDAENVVLLDGDIAPDRTWLEMLISPLAKGDYDIVTAHRWHVVSKHRLGAHLAAAIDRSLTLLPRLDTGMAQVTWGGSVAMTVQTAAKLELAECLRGRLSDDLSIGIRASQRGLRVATRSGLLVASPVDHTLGSAWLFGRRQYQIGKVYRRDLWLLALVGLTIRVLGFVCSLMLAGGYGEILPLICLMGLGLIKQVLVCAVGARAGVQDDATTWVFQALLGMLQPLVDAFHLSVAIAAAWTRKIRWAHITYGVDGPDAIRVVERRPYSS